MVQAVVSPKSNQLICLTSSFALILENSVGFSTFGVEVASSTSSPIKLSSLGSPIARRVRRRPEVSAVTTGCSTADASAPLERAFVVEASA